MRGGSRGSNLRPCKERGVERFSFTSDGCAASRKPSGILLLNFIATSATRANERRLKHGGKRGRNNAEHGEIQTKDLGHAFINPFIAMHCEMPVALASGHKRMVKDTKLCHKLHCMMKHKI